MLQSAFDVCEVSRHPGPIQASRFHREEGPSIVAVKLAAFSLVTDESVPKAEFHLSNDTIHEAMHSLKEYMN